MKMTMLKILLRGTKVTVKLKIISLIVVFLCCLITLEIYAATEVKNPLDDFEFSPKLSTNITPDEVLAFQLDLNSDAKNEVFLSHEKDINGRLGNMWMVYISHGDKFLRSDTFIDLVPGDLIQKVYTKTGQTRLITFRYPESGILILTEITVSDANVVMNKIAKIELLGEYKLLSESFFDLFDDGNISKISVTQGSLADLRKTFIIEETKPTKEPNLPAYEPKPSRHVEEVKQASQTKPFIVALITPTVGAVLFFSIAGIILYKKRTIFRK
jgi:hypothetical protein